MAPEKIQGAPIVRLRDFNFTGPLDLLLHLVTRAELDVRGVLVAEITEQYLATLTDGLDGLDMDQASAFLEMAATLLEIKSRALLPKPPEPEPDESPEEALVRRLAEFARLKDAMGGLRACEQDAMDAFGKLPEDVPMGPPDVIWTNLTLQSLSQALRDVLARAKAREAQAGLDDESERRVRSLLKRDAATLQQCMFRVMRRLGAGACTFDSLFDAEPYRDEVVAMFLAVLELHRLGRVRLAQEGAFCTVYLYPIKGSRKPDMPSDARPDAQEALDAR